MPENKKNNKNFEVIVKTSDIPLGEREKRMQKWIKVLLFGDKNINDDKK